MKNKKYLIIASLIIILIIFSISVFAIDVPAVKFCCEKTTYGAWCQNAPAEQCDNNFRKESTSCDSVSYCKKGCCYDSAEGICMENTPEKVCSMSNGTWADSKDCNIAQCNSGCCVIGTQAAFVTLTRCKKLSRFYGLQVDFRTQITNELSCVSLASLSDQGACVYDIDFVKTCKFSSRQECNSIKVGNKIGQNLTAGGTVTGNVTFYKDLLCSAEELGTNCVMTKDTTCLDGKDEVYFKDSCGNIANIYDSSKITDKAYWRKRVLKQDSCNPASGNINSKSCGNCDYLSGSLCKKTSRANSPQYGDNICDDLNCKETSLGIAMKHGESWCSTDANIDSVGSRYYRHICISGEEIVEPCADLRKEICIQDYITSKGIKFSQAGCRANRYLDCLQQTDKLDCLNTDKRDCVWRAGDNVTLEATQTTQGTGNTTITVNNFACFPLHAPGYNFWQQGEAQQACAQASVQCVVKYSEDLLGNRECVENCECLTDQWKNEQLGRCEAIGDCGVKVNFLGASGYKAGYKFKINITS